MKLLRCKFCRGEVDIVNDDRSVNKKVKCNRCSFSNVKKETKEPEVFVIRKRPTFGGSF